MKLLSAEGTYVFQLVVTTAAGVASDPQQVTVLVAPVDDDVPVLSVTSVATTTRFVAYPGPVGAWQAYIPGLGLAAPLVTGQTAYLVCLGGSASQSLSF